MEEILKPMKDVARDALMNWENDIHKNVYTNDPDYMHSIHFYFLDNFQNVHDELTAFGELIATHLERLVQENNLASNLPRLESYNALGIRIDEIKHHPTYIQAGNIIYQTQLLEKMSKAGGLLASLSFLFLSGQIGEGGHNCPIACSAGIIRMLQKMPDFPNKSFYLEKLTTPSYEHNFTGAQFLTEIQGGSDVGLNAVSAKQEGNVWRIDGEKWFCSNAGANLIFLTARINKEISGTKGLGLFLVPSEWNGHRNHYFLRRLKDKIGTRSMATAEIDFNGAYAILIGSVDEGIHLVMDNVLHLSRLFNSFCVLGMARRAYTIAYHYAKHRIAFAHPIIDYPLVQENLARIKAENLAMTAGIFATAKLQDQYDLEENTHPNTKLLLRLLVNLQKYLTARWSFEHIHHAIDVLAGNGTIETFSPLPRLLRDCIVCENWEGTHNVLRMQILKDILKYDIDRIYMTHLQAELDKLKSFSLHTHDIVKELGKLSAEIQTFRELKDTDLQALHIRFIVDHMAIIYCALMLLHEALHQQKKGSSSKLDSYHYFCMLHFNKEVNYDTDYLNLIRRVININSR